MDNLRIIISTTNADIADELCYVFQKEEKVSIYNGEFKYIESYDCIASPANSFGLMDGGMDKDIIDYFGKELEERVQKFILEHYSGEQPVGTSFIVETNDFYHPFLAHSPTMRTPDRIDGSLNVYYATKATLEEIKKHNNVSTRKIKTLLLPAFGGGTGNMDAEALANQMYLAYQHVKNPPKSINWGFAYDREKEIEKNRH